jgi:hypothetical protein
LLNRRAFFENAHALCALQAKHNRWRYSEKVGLGDRLTAIATTHLLSGRYHAPMWRSQIHPDPLSLEVCAERAGAAWACEHANSAEFDAALIAARRAAGVYGPKRHRRQMLLIAVGIAAGLVVVALLIV